MDALTALVRSALSSPEADLLIDELANRVVARLREDAVPVMDGWFDSARAAAYLGLPSVNAIHKLTAGRAIPFSQDAPGGKCWFKRSDLDAFRERSAT